MSLHSSAVTLESSPEEGRSAGFTSQATREEASRR